MGEQTSFDAVVNASFGGANGTVVNGVKTYKTLKAALDYIGSGANKTIFIESGTYKEKLTISAPKNLTLIGATNGVTTLTYGDCSTVAGGTDQSASITVTAEGFRAFNVKFENSYDYLKGSEKDKQALAFLIRADKGAFYNCEFWGHQDTIEIVNGRHYFKNCLIAGSVDFIFGNNPSVLFESCEIKLRNRNSSNGGYITAMKGNNGTNDAETTDYGLVFKNCKITKESGVSDGSVSLGRPWRKNATVAWINCEMGSHISKKAYDGNSSKCRYVYMNGGTDSGGNKIKNEPQNAKFVEYGNTGAGAITSAVKGCTMLTKAQADAYTMANIFAKKNGQVTYSTDFNPQA